MNRETKIIKVGDHNVVVKTYATAREAQIMQKSAFAGLKIDIVNEQPKITDFNPAVQVEIEKSMIETLVVSVDEKSEGIAETVLDWKADDYTDLVSQLNDILSKKKN